MSKIILGTKAANEQEQKIEQIKSEITLAEPEKKQVKQLFEDVSKRESNIKHYKMSDGTYQAQIFNEPVHFYDENEGKYLDIDNTFKEELDGDDDEKFDGFVNKQSDFRVKFNKKIDDNKLFVLKKGEYKLIWNLLGKKDKQHKHKKNHETCAECEHDVETKRVRNEIKYCNFVENTDLQYVLTPTKIKENIIVKERQEDYEYQFELTARNLDVDLSQDQKKLEFYINKLDDVTGEISKEVVFQIPMPYMYDAAGAQSSSVNYEIEPASGDKYIFSIIADKKWINAEERVFPVTIDPAIMLDNEKVYLYGIDALYNADENENNDTFNRYIGHGRSSEIDEGYLSRAYFRLILPSIFDNVIISSAKFNLKCKANATSGIEATTNYGYIVAECGEFDVSKPNFYENLYDTIDYINAENIVKDEWVTFNITKLFKHSNGTKYFVIKKVDETLYSTSFNHLVFYNEHGPNTQSIITVSYSLPNAVKGNKSQQNDVKRAGSSSVDLYKGTLKFVHNDVNLGGERLPLNVSHVYNKELVSSINYINTSLGTKYINTYMGNGWKLNLQQYLFPTNFDCETYSGNTPEYIYIDQYGDEHTFIKRLKAGATDENDTEIVDESGLGLTFSEDGSYKILSDKIGNKMYFLSNRLVRIQDHNGNITYITYDSCNRIYSVRDGASRYAYFYYNSYNCLLDRIQYSNGKKIYYTYSGNNLTQIKYPDNNVSQYGYTNNLLSSARDMTGYTLKYTYSGNKVTQITEQTDVNKIAYNSITSLTTPQVGNSINISYSTNRTTVQTANGDKVTYVFDNTGFAYNIYEDKSETTSTNYINATGALESYHYDEVEFSSFKISGTEENMLTNGGFEETTTCWNTNGNMGVCDCVTTVATAEGNRGYRIYGEIDKEKYIYQYVYPEENDSNQAFVVSAFAKADAISGAHSKFRLVADVFYSVTDHEIYERDFNYLETGWQMASVGFSCPTGKTIMFVMVKLEYSHNVNSVVFDNIQMVKAQYSKVKSEAGLIYNNGESEQAYLIKQITGIKYKKDGTEKTEIPTDNKLTYDDVRYMKQTGYVYLAGGIEAKKSVSDIRLTVGTTELEISSLTINGGSTTQTENGNGIKTITVSDEYGNPTQTEITDENGITSKFTYGYDLKHNLITETDERRDLTKTYQRNSYGNVTNTTLSVVGDSDETNAIKQVTGYNSNGNYSQTTYDERYTKDGALLYTTTSYDNTNDQLNYVVLPNGEKINYDYYTNGNLMGISCHIDGASGTCTCDSTIQTNCSCTGCSHITYEYTAGLLTRLVSNTATYNFEYDGFGVVTSVKLNNTEMLALSYKNNCTYVLGTPESEYDYTQVNYANGHKSKEILDKNQNIISKKYITPSGTEYEILRQGFDEKGKILQSVDKSVSVCYNVNGESDTTNKDLTYTYAYKDNGALDKITYSGYRTGSIQHVSDKQGRATQSKITFGEEKNYTYNYETIPNTSSKYADNRIKSVVLPGMSNVTYEYDALGRFLSRNIAAINASESYTYKKSNYDYSICREDRTTNYIEKVTYKNNGTTVDIAEYTYDKNGNIASIYANGKYTYYHYDGIGRLYREDNEALGKTWVLTYDTDGNITGEKIADYTTGNVAIYMQMPYTYNEAKQITGYGAKSIGQYDALGNPVVYGGNILSWTRGRLLNSYGTISKYYYDINGIRQEKIANGVKYTYYTEGERIHKEVYGSNTLWYYYDQTGVTAMDYNGARYFFQKNLQGDIIRVLDSTGTIIASYTYDAWGVHKVYDSTGVENTSTTFIGNINPFRYRGYYYDAETGLYYLNSRYYDPQVRRFINAKDICNLNPESIGGFNQYSYCGNNSIMFKEDEIFGGISINSLNINIIEKEIGYSTLLTSVPEWMKIIIGAIPDIITSIKYLHSSGIHRKFAYSTSQSYMYPIMGSTWRRFSKNKINYSNLTGANFKQIITGNARASVGAVFKSIGKVAAISALVNFVFNFSENNWQLNEDVLIDTVIDTAIGVGSYLMAAGTMSLITAGVLATTGLAIPGIVAVGGIFLLSMGFEALIRWIIGL